MSCQYGGSRNRSANDDQRYISNHGWITWICGIAVMMPSTMNVPNVAAIAASGVDVSDDTNSPIPASPSSDSEITTAIPSAWSRPSPSETVVPESRSTSQTGNSTD